MQRSSKVVLTLAVVSALGGFGCSAAEDDTGGTAGSGSNVGGAAGVSGGMAGTTGGVAGTTGGTGSNVGGTGGTGVTGGTSGGVAGSGGGGTGGTGGGVTETLDPSVDWTALTLVYTTAYTAYDGVHTFQVPFRVDGATVDLAGWSAIPSSAVQFDPDPEGGGVLVTVLQDVPEITIAARSGAIGGTAPLYVTSATPAQWEAGEARYNNGVDFTIDALTPDQFLALLLDPNWMPPSPPGDSACNNCHTTGAKYFEIQHSPTQAARFSDADLRQILTTGTKPEGIGFRVLPDMLGNQTDAELYADFHTWDSTEDEITGLIVYLRSLTPVGQGDILLPDGTYVPPGGTDGQ